MIDIQTVDLVESAVVHAIQVALLQYGGNTVRLQPRLQTVIICVKNKKEETSRNESIPLAGLYWLLIFVK